MDLQKAVKTKIVEEVLSLFPSGWAVLVYDTPAAQIIEPLFNRTDFLSYNIMSADHIAEERESFDFPVIYFVDCTSEVSKLINAEVKAKKYADTYVCSITEPQDLDKMIRVKRVGLNVRCEEKRIFFCEPEQINYLMNILDANIDVNYMPCLESLAKYLYSNKDLSVSKPDINGNNSRSSTSVANNTRTDNANNANPGNVNSANANSANANSANANNKGGLNASLLLIDRHCDLFTPLLHWFSFKSALMEIKEKVKEDILWKDVRYKHIADISGVLQFNLSKIQQETQKLEGKKIDTVELGKMVMDAPKNMEIKAAIEKYSIYLDECFKRVELLQELIEAEQVLVTGYDKKGKKAQRGLDYFFESLRSTKYAREDRTRLLYLVKAKGLAFTQTEVEMLENFGFDSGDVNVQLDLSQSIERKKKGEYRFDISRYEPIAKDLIGGFIKEKPIFKHIGKRPEQNISLRKSFMISETKKTVKQIIVVYFKGGMTYEECRLAYSLSEEFGVELLFGSERIITPEMFIKELKAKGKKKASKSK
ncbi:hypothetical protein ENBRE01_1099 [Enteropsectra breve]|nr:hypothetical protein ENBRE01_1099 [Enteropsectra breve]